MIKQDDFSDMAQYMEEHLSHELNPETIAQKHFISLSQLYRDFYSYTGHTIKEYIRKRRISNACEKIKFSDSPLSMVVSQSGCQTQQSFHKQFKSLVGMTPMDYKHSETYFYFYPCSVNRFNTAVKVGMETIPACTTRSVYAARQKGIEDLAVEQLGLFKGRVFGKNGGKDGNRYCYKLLMENESDSCFPSFGQTGLYASCVVAYHEKDIQDAWNYLYNTWLDASMFEQSDAYFEEFLFRKNKPYKLKLYLPVRKRESARNIVMVHREQAFFLISKEAGGNAEHRASENILLFLHARYPSVLNQARRFYVREYGDTYECGVEIDQQLVLLENSRLEIRHIPKGLYAVLPDDCFGDISVGTARMEQWLSNNGIKHGNEPVFAVYESQNGQYDTKNVKMRLYKRLLDK